MYTPPAFVQHDSERIVELIKAQPLATLVVAHNEHLEATHIPLCLAPMEAQAGETHASDLVLWGHVAKANPIWQMAREAQNALVIFQGPDAYISPSNYPTKKEHGKVVPTWNYVAVHLKGRLQVHEDAAWLRHMLDALTDTHEAIRAQPWQVNDAPATYIDRQLKGIVGLEFRATSIDAKWKLSQNQPAENYEGVVAGLQKEASPVALAVAQLMQQAREP